VSIRHVDARFVLPFAVEQAVVLGELPRWRDGLAEAGIEVTEYLSAHRAPQLVVAPVSIAADALATRPDAIIVEGRRGARSLRKNGGNVQRLVPTPSIAVPRRLLCTDHANASVYAIERLGPAVNLPKQVRNWTAKTFLARGRFPEVVPVIAVATAQEGPPFFLAEAAELGIPADAEWFMSLGEIDALSRSAFQVFAPGDAEPSWIVKVARVPGYTAPFDRDARGIRLASSAGAAARAHVPRILGRLEVGGLHASVEVAAVGYNLTQFVQQDIPQEEKLRVVEAVAEWIVELGRSTTKSPDALREERDRLTTDVLPRWADSAIPASLVKRIPPVSAVLQHADMGSWNVIARSGSEFTVIDWESVRENGFPLWDLVFFLTDALLTLDGAPAASVERERETVRLFHGEATSSGVLFRWLRHAVRTFAIPADAVGPIVTLCWLHYGTADVSRSATRGDLGATERWGEIEAERIARLWVSEPGLGPGWDAWRRE
jgi:hypothetical protein